MNCGLNRLFQRLSHEVASPLTGTKKTGDRPNSCCTWAATGRAIFSGRSHEAPPALDSVFVPGLGSPPDRKASVVAGTRQFHPESYMFRRKAISYYSGACDVLCSSRTRRFDSVGQARKQQFYRQMYCRQLFLESPEARRDWTSLPGSVGQEGPAW